MKWPNLKSSIRIRFPVAQTAAYFAAFAGVVLIVISGTYIYSRSRSGDDAAKFTYAVPDEIIGAHLGRSAGVIADGPVIGELPIPFAIKRPNVARFANLYPGDSLNPKYWGAPEWAGSDPFGGPTIPDDFIPVLSTDIFRDFDSSSDAVRMRIPSINLDSTVEELAILDLGDSREYETPDRTVGHIPETANPGQQGSAWFFGHLESYAAGEGNVFRKLPNITELIKQDPVDIYLETNDIEFIYRVTQTSQIPEDELRLTSSEDAQITLVACWPPRVYDQRILVDATLIAYRQL